LPHIAIIWKPGLGPSIILFHPTPLPFLCVKLLKDFLSLTRGLTFPLLSWAAWLWIEQNPQGSSVDALGVRSLEIQGGVIFALMMGCVFSVDRYADRVAERLGEPYGTLVLTLSATIIEVSLLLQVMVSGDHNPSLMRDTVYATLMVVLNGIVGISLTAGGWRHIEQAFDLRGALAYFHIIAPLSLFVLVLPNFTGTDGKPTLEPSQEAFLGILCMVVYGVFLRLQMGRHRSHFGHVASTGWISPRKEAKKRALERNSALMWSLIGLGGALLPVLLLSEHLAKIFDHGMQVLKWPAGFGGLLITSLVLAPEGLGALRAALSNRMQRSINICLGSALATIAVTVPTVLIASALMGHSLVLGVKATDITLLSATLLVVLVTFVSGKANLLQGIVHLMIFVAYLFFMFKP